MSIDFFKNECSNTLSDEKFGLCDDGNNEKAYTDINNNSKWIATVTNKNSHKIKFIAVDNCIELDKKKCDAIMTFSKNIIFVELKNNKGKKSNRWLNEDTINQLKSTINHFKLNHNIDIYNKKTAYISNKQKPNFENSSKTRMENFHEDTSVKLRIRADIDI